MIGKTAHDDELARWVRGLEPTVIIPDWMVTVPANDPVRVRLEWRTDLVKMKLQLQEEERDGKDSI